MSEQPWWAAGWACLGLFATKTVEPPGEELILEEEGTGRWPANQALFTAGREWFRVWPSIHLTTSFDSQLSPHQSPLDFFRRPMESKRLYIKMERMVWTKTWLSRGNQLWDLSSGKNVPMEGRLSPLQHCGTLQFCGFGGLQHLRGGGDGSTQQRRRCLASWWSVWRKLRGIKWWVTRTDFCLPFYFHDAQTSSHPQSNGPLMMSRSYYLEPVNKLHYMARGH